MTDAATLAGLDPTTLGDLLRVAGSPGFDRWQDHPPHRRLLRPHPPHRLHQDPRSGDRQRPARLLDRRRARWSAPPRLR